MATVQQDFDNLKTEIAARNQRPAAIYARDCRTGMETGGGKPTGADAADAFWAERGDLQENIEWINDNK